MRNTWYIMLIGICTIVMMLSGCGQATKSQSDIFPGKMTITDASGVKVEIPKDIKRIGDAWNAHNEVLCILGAGDKIVVTTEAAAKRPWMRKINPHMRSAVTAFGTADANLEALIKAKPDIVFMTQNQKNAKKIAELGIPVVQLSFKDFASLKECVRLTGAILGGEGTQKAEKYANYLDEKLAMINGITAGISRDEKPKVLHVSSLSPLMASGKDTIINTWIETAGGINVADISGNGQEASMERLVEWNPDIIIIGNTALASKDLPEILHDEIWQQINAVKNRKVYVNPEGMFYWDRYGAEEALQIQWAAKLFYPDKFSNIDMIRETRYFYQTFLNYELSEDEARRILSAMPPEDGVK